MTQGKLESIPLEVQKQMSSLETRIMQDIVMRIKVNGFSSATADWEITRLQQLGQSEEDIRKWIKEALSATDEEVDRIFSDEAYSEYYGHERAYQVMGFTQIPFEQNEVLQQYIKAAAEQTKGTFQNLTASMGFAVRQPGTGNIKTKKLRTYYVETLDKAINDIHSGAFDYNTVLRRTIKELTDSGLRTIGYESTSGRTTSTRVDVAARRAIMTGFRQVQAKINEQVMDDLHTEYVEVSYHVGARPTHQVWQGKVYHWDRGAGKGSSKNDSLESDKSLQNSAPNAKIDTNRNSTGQAARSIEELTEAAETIKEYLPDYTDRESKWSGKILVDNSLLEEEALGQKEWNCDITLADTADDGVITHELLHSCSASHYEPTVFDTNGQIEEASVQYLTEQICKEKGISTGTAYEESVLTLRSLNNMFQYGSDMEFAKELFAVPLAERYQWLEDMVAESMKAADVSFYDFYDIMGLMERNLKGRLPE